MIIRLLDNVGLFDFERMNHAGKQLSLLFLHIFHRCANMAKIVTQRGDIHEACGPASFTKGRKGTPVMKKLLSLIALSCVMGIGAGVSVSASPVTGAVHSLKVEQTSVIEKAYYRHRVARRHYRRAYRRGYYGYGTGYGYYRRPYYGAYYGGHYRRHYRRAYRRRY